MGKTQVMVKTSSWAKVKFFQEDMRGFRENLQYKSLQYPEDYSTAGDQFYEEVVDFAELWIYSIKNRRESYGRIIRGFLYLYNSKANSFEGPAELPVGKYKVWVDAWILKDLNSEFYQTSTPFTAADWEVWEPPKLPKRKYWQTITIRPPEDLEEPCVVWIKSRRFHWLYRIDSLLSVLRSSLQSYESLSKDAMAFQEMAIVMNNFLYILKESGNNLGAWVSDGSFSSGETYFDMWEKMMQSVYYPAVYTGKWILGLDYENTNLMNEIKHLNNLAALLWHFLEQREFIEALRIWDKFLPEEARVLISMIGPVLTRIPRAADIPKPAYPRQTVYANNLSPEWGQMFVNDIYKPFISNKRKEKGATGPPAFPPSKSSSKALPEVLNSVRKYIFGTFNGISVILITKADVAAQLSEHWKELGELLEWDEFFEPHHLVRLYRDYMGKLPDTTDGKILAYVEERLDKIFELEDRPEKLTSAIAKTNPCAIYFLESFEVAVKGWVVVLAYQKLVIEGRKNLPRNLIEATGSTASFVGTGLKSTMLEGFLTSRKVSPTTIAELTKWGKGLSFAGELAGAGIYIYDKWIKDNSVGKEVSGYTDKDAYAIESFHIAVASGKVVAAVGAGLEMTVVGAPVGTIVLGIGYGVQFVGEFLIELWRIGAAEKKMWETMVGQLYKLNLNLMRGERTKLYSLNFLPDKNYQFLKSMVDDFKWMDMDKEKWDNYVKSFSIM